MGARGRPSPRRGRPVVRRPDPDWFAFVQVGDVLRWPSGDLRVVRQVTRREEPRPWRRRADESDPSYPGRLLCICVAIRRRSRYNSPDTCFHKSDLKTLGVQYVGARVKLDSPMDAHLAECVRLNLRDRLPEKNPTPYRALTADDVRGLP